MKTRRADASVPTSIEYAARSSYALIDNLARCLWTCSLTLLVDLALFCADS